MGYGRRQGLPRPEQGRSGLYRIASEAGRRTQVTAKVKGSNPNPTGADLEFQPVPRGKNGSWRPNRIARSAGEIAAGTRHIATPAGFDHRPAIRPKPSNRPKNAELVLPAARAECKE